MYDGGQHVTKYDLETLVAAVTACGNDGVDRAETISFALWCYETAGRERPDFGRFSEQD